MVISLVSWITYTCSTKRKLIVADWNGASTLTLAPHLCNAYKTILLFKWPKIFANSCVWIAEQFKKGYWACRTQSSGIRKDSVIYWAFFFLTTQLLGWFKKILISKLDLVPLTTKPSQTRWSPVNFTTFLSHLHYRSMRISLHQQKERVKNCWKFKTGDLCLLF